MPIDQKDALALSNEDLELICSLKLDPLKNNTFKNSAKQLAQKFQEGDTTNTIKDYWKAEKYRKIAEGEVDGEEPLPWNTKTAYGVLSDYNGIRLFAQRVFNVAKNIFSSLVKQYPFLPILLTIASFSAGIELLIDISMLFKNTFFPQGKNTDLTYYARFKNTLFKDNRAFRMLNAAVWFSVNLTCFMLGGVLLVGFLNLGGFLVHDLSVSVYKLHKERNKIHRLIQKLKAHPKKDSEEIQEKLKQKDQEQTKKLTSLVYRDITLVASWATYFCTQLISFFPAISFAPFLLVPAACGFLASWALTPNEDSFKRQKFVLLGVGIMAIGLAIALPVFLPAFVSFLSTNTLFLAITMGSSLLMGSVLNGFVPAVWNKLLSRPGKSMKDKNSVVPLSYTDIELTQTPTTTLASAPSPSLTNPATSMKKEDSTAPLNHGNSEPTQQIPLSPQILPSPDSFSNASTPLMGTQHLQKNSEEVMALRRSSDDYSRSNSPIHLNGSSSSQIMQMVNATSSSSTASTPMSQGTPSSIFSSTASTPATLGQNPEKSSHWSKPPRLPRNEHALLPTSSDPRTQKTLSSSSNINIPETSPIMSALLSASFLSASLSVKTSSTASTPTPQSGSTPNSVSSSPDTLRSHHRGGSAPTYSAPTYYDDTLT